MDGMNNPLVSALVVMMTVVLVSMFVPALTIITIMKPVEVSSILLEVALSELVREGMRFIKTN